MLPETQQEILSWITQVWMALAPAVGRESLTHEEGVQFLLGVFGSGKIPFSFIFQSQAAASLLPPQSADAKSKISEKIALWDTNEKLSAYLSSLPEPTLDQLDQGEKFIKGLLPGLRKIFELQIAKFPLNEGGRPPLFSRTEEAAIREEITVLRGPGVHLKDVFRRVAQRHGVSEATVKLIWRKGLKK